MLDPQRVKTAEAERKRAKILEQASTTMVFREKPGEPRPAFILKRGEYDQRGEKVVRAVPAFLPPLPPGAPVTSVSTLQVEDASVPMPSSAAPIATSSVTYTPR